MTARESTHKSYYPVASLFRGSASFFKGEKTTEAEDRDRLFSEREYGRFGRRIPVEEIEEFKVNASFRNGVLTMVLRKSARAQRQAKRIAIYTR